MDVSAVLRWLISLSLISFSSLSFSLYESNIQQADQWLVSQQNADGSWGIGAQQFIATAEVVKALRASNLREEAYYRGVTWLENHAAINTDYAIRRSVALLPHGNTVTESLLTSLDQAQTPALSLYRGWGISQDYLQSPLDTALVLSGLRVLGTSIGSASVSVQPAIDYLKSLQLVDNGWTVQQGNTFDTFTTAIVTKGLAEWQVQDSSLAAIVNAAVDLLQIQVPSSASPVLQALSAQAAYFAGDESAYRSWLNPLSSQQSVDGSWNNNIYATALVIQTMAAADGINSAENQTRVDIPDENLRTAINLALGRGALDTLERGELAQLTTLDIRNVRINDLTGLEYATNLTTLDARDNNITSTSPIDNLPILVTVLLDGNPVAPSAIASDEDIPTLPEWGMIFMACLLLWQVFKRQRDHHSPDHFAA